jgi:hypothetical protein
MNCQECGEVATHHVTEIVAGKLVEYHVCDKHVQELGTIEPFSWPYQHATGFMAFFQDPQLQEALREPAARQELAAHVLPALCLALLNERPEVRIVSAFRLLLLGADGRPAAGALRDALRDPDERVRKAARIALEWVETEEAEGCLLP